MLRNSVQVVNDVEQMVVWLPQAAVMHLILQKQVICWGRGEAQCLTRVPVHILHV